MQNKNTFGFKTLFKSLLSALNIKKGILPTLRDLIIRPHIVTNHYIESNKNIYISPAKLFIVAVSLVALANIFSNEEIDKDPLSLIELTEKNETIKPITPVFKVMNKSPFSYLFFLIIPFTIITRTLSYKSKKTFAMHLVYHMYTTFFIAVLFTLSDIIIGGFLDEISETHEDWFGFTSLGIIISYYVFSLQRFIKNSFLIAIFKVITMLISTLFIYLIINEKIDPNMRFKRFDYEKFFMDIGIWILIPILIFIIRKIFIYIKRKN